MTSIQRSPLDLLTSAQGPISSELLDKALAGVPSETKNVVLNDLRELVATKSLGAASPKVTDELAARLSALPAETKPRPLNQLAGLFFKNATPPPSSEPIYIPAYAVQAQIVGARTALAGQMSETNDVERETKERMTDLVKNADSDMALSLIMSTWASFAEPAAEAGKFKLPAEIVKGLPEALSALADGLRKAKTLVLQGTMKALVQAVSGGAPVAGAEGPEAEEALVVPSVVAGKDEAALRPLVDAALTAGKVGRIVYDPDQLRPSRYAAMVEKIESHPLTPQLKPVVRRWLEEMIKQRIDEEGFQGKEITKDTPREDTDAQLRAMFYATREMGNQLGAGDNLTVVRLADDRPNAYVYTPDFDNPRVVVNDSTARMCWDTVRDTWLGPDIAVDAQGQTVPADSPDAVVSGPAGKLLFQAVVGHELLHISDGISTNRILLMILLGNGLFDTDALTGNAHVHSSGCGCSMVASKQDVEIYSKLMESSAVKRFLPPGGLSKDASVIAERTSALFGPSFAAGGGLVDQMGLEAEVTADHGSVAAQGTNKFLPTFFEIIQNHSEQGSTEDRQRALQNALDRDLTKFHTKNLESKVDSSYNGLSAIGSGSSHPPPSFRAIETAKFLKTPYAQKVAQYKALPSALKLVAGAQAIDYAIEHLEDGVDKLQNSLALSTDVVAGELTANVEKRKLLERLKPITSQIAELAFADGVGIENNKPKGYIFTVLGFLKQGGVPLFQDESTSPMDFIRNGGQPSEPRAPMCVNIYAQLSEELEIKLAAAGEKMPAEQREIWGLILDQLEAAAGEGESTLGAIRRQAALSSGAEKLSKRFL